MKLQNTDKLCIKIDCIIVSCVKQKSWISKTPNSLKKIMLECQ